MTFAVLAAEAAKAGEAAKKLDLEEVAAKAMLIIAFVVILGRLVAVLFRKMKQPAVMGEILTGIALGPSLLGLIDEDLPKKLFPAEIRPFLRVIAEIGLIIFMFVVGLEVDPAVVRRSGRKATVISITSIIFPFALGSLVLAPVLYPDHDIVNGEKVKRIAFVLFVGVSMCATAFAILARVLQERKMFAIPLGTLLISCAAVDDVLAFSLLAVVLGVAGGGGHGGPAVQWRLIGLVVFVAFLYIVVRRLMQRFVVDRYNLNRRLTPDLTAILFCSVFVAAFTTFKLGLAPLIGAFMLGACMPRDRSHEMFEVVVERVEGFAVVLLMPVFFVVTGLNVDIRGLGTKNILPALFVLAVACIGKFVGAAIAAKTQGVSNRQALAIGVMMNTRGLAELVILNIGREAGILDAQMFTMLVIMAVVTTVMAGPVLRLVYPDRWLEREIAEAERQRLGVSGKEPVMAVIEQLDAAPALADLAARLRWNSPLDLSIVRFSPLASGADGELAAGFSGGMAAMTESLGVLQGVRRRIEPTGAAVAITSRVANDPAEEVMRSITATSPAVVLLGKATDPAISSRILREAQHIVVTVAGPVFDPSASGPVVVEAGSGNTHMAALEVAVRLARTVGAELVLSPAKEGDRPPTGRIERQLDEFSIAHRTGTEPIDRIVAGASAERAPIAVVVPLDGRRFADSVVPLLEVRAVEGDQRTFGERLAPPTSASSSPPSTSSATAPAHTTSHGAH